MDRTRERTMRRLVKATLVTILWASFALPCFGMLESGAQGSGNDLLGVWNMVTYHFQGKDYAAKGILIFTEKHFSINVSFQLEERELSDLTVDAGTYTMGPGNKVTYKVMIASAIRPGDKVSPIQQPPTGEPETGTYALDGDELTLNFVTGNWFVAERLE